MGAAIGALDLGRKPRAPRKLRKPLCHRITAGAGLWQHLDVFGNRGIYVPFPFVHGAKPVRIYGLVSRGLAQVLEYSYRLIELIVVPVHCRDSAISITLPGLQLGQLVPLLAGQLELTTFGIRFARLDAVLMFRWIDRGHV